MKTKTLLLAAAVLACGLITVPAQTNATGTFADSVKNYFTSFDTNSTTFTSERLELWTAVDQNPDAMAAVLGVTYDLPKNLVIEGVFKNASVAGTLVAAQGGLGYRIVHFDTQFTVGLDVGSRFDNGSHGFVDAFADVRKALTENTYAGLRLYYEQPFVNGARAHAPGLMVITGCKF